MSQTRRVIRAKSDDAGRRLPVFSVIAVSPGTVALDGVDSQIYRNSNTAYTLDNVDGTIEGTGSIVINNVGAVLALINEAAGTFSLAEVSQFPTIDLPATIQRR